MSHAIRFSSNHNSRDDGTVEEEALRQFQSSLSSDQGNRIDNNKGRRRTRAFFKPVVHHDDGGGDTHHISTSSSNTAVPSTSRTRHSVSSPYHHYKLQEQILKHDAASEPTRQVHHFARIDSPTQQPDFSSTENLTVTQQIPKKPRASRKNTLTPMTSSSILNAASNLLKNQGESSPTPSVDKSSASSSSELKLSVDNNLVTEFHNFPNQSPSSSSSTERKRSLINLNVCYLNLSPPEHDSYLERLNEEDEDDSSAESLTSSIVYELKNDDSFPSTIVKDEIREETQTEEIVDSNNDLDKSIDPSSSPLENIISIEENPPKEEQEECKKTDELVVEKEEQQCSTIPVQEEHSHEPMNDEPLIEISKEIIKEARSEDPTTTSIDIQATTEETSADKLPQMNGSDNTPIFQEDSNDSETENIENIEQKPTEESKEAKDAENMEQTSFSELISEVEKENKDIIEISDSIVQQVQEKKNETEVNTESQIMKKETEIIEHTEEVSTERQLMNPTTINEEMIKGEETTVEYDLKVILDTTTEVLGSEESPKNTENENECETNGIVTETETVELSCTEKGENQHSIDQDEFSPAEPVSCFELNSNIINETSIDQKNDEIENSSDIQANEITPVAQHDDLEMRNILEEHPEVNTKVEEDLEPITVSTENSVEIQDEEVTIPQPSETPTPTEADIDTTVTEPVVEEKDNIKETSEVQPEQNTEINDQIPTIANTNTPNEISQSPQLIEPPTISSNEERVAKSELITPHNFETTVNDDLTISFPKKRTHEDGKSVTDSCVQQQAQQEDNISEKELQQDSPVDIVKSDAMSNNNSYMYQTPYEEQLDVLDRGNDEDDIDESSIKQSVLEEYLLSKLNEEAGYDDLEKKVFASFEGDFSSYEQAIREEIRFLSESIEKKSKDIQDSEPVISTPQPELRPNIDLKLFTPDSPSFNIVIEDFLSNGLKSRISPRRLFSHQRINTLSIRSSIEEYDNQRLVYEKQRDFNTLNTFDIKIRKEILYEVIKIEDRFEREYEQRKKNIKELLEDQKLEILDLWTKRILEYDQLSGKILLDITERHKHEIVQQEEKLRVSFGRKKPNFSKNTLAERSLYNLIASSKQYERGLGMEEKITNLERKDIINFYHQQEQHVTKKLEFVASKQLQELSVTQQRIDRGRKEMEMYMEDDIKKVDNRSNILFKDMERKKAVVSTQLRTFKEKFKGTNSPVKKQVFLHSEDFEDPIQESTVNINACLEFFLIIPDKVNHFFQSVDKKETEVERETCNVIRRLVDRIEGSSQLSPKSSTTSKSPSMEKKLNTSVSPKAKISSPTSLFKDVMPSSPSSSSDSITPKKSLKSSPLKESPKKTPARSPYSLEEGLRNKKKPTPKHNFSTLMQYNGSKTHIK